MLTTSQIKPITIESKVEIEDATLEVVALEKTNETLALLKILDMAQQDIDAGRVHTLVEVMNMLEQKRGKFKNT